MAKKKFYVDIDLKQNELLQARLQNSTTPPVNPVRGQVYFDTTLNQIGICVNAVTPEWKYGGEVNEVVGEGALYALVNGDTVTMRIRNASQTEDGAMSKEDKIKLDNATNENIPESLILRDIDGNFIANIITANSITGLQTPVNPTDAVNKSYVDAMSYGLDVKASVRILSISNISLSGIGQTVSGVTVEDGDRILVFNQTVNGEDGIYIANSGVWIRSLDFENNSNAANVFTFIEEGTYADTGWICTNDRGSDIVGIDRLLFVQFSAAGQLVAGDAIEKNGNVLNVLYDTNTIKIDINNKLTIGDHTARVGYKSVALGDAIGPVQIVHNWNTKNVSISVYDSITMDEAEIYKKPEDVNYIVVDAMGSTNVMNIIVIGNIAQAF